MITWFAARHVLYMMICYSLWIDSATVISSGCYHGKAGAIAGPFPPPDRFQHLLEPFRDPEGVVCWTDNIRWSFLSALLFLQCITLMWFWMIVKVAVQVVRGGQADDTRSDDEGENVEHEDEKTISNLEHLEQDERLMPFEEEVGVEAINLKGRTSSASKNRYRKSASSAGGVSSSSGLHLPGHGDRKELLGRIGCDKPV